MSRIEVTEEDVRHALRMVGMLEAYERKEISEAEARAIAERRVRDLRGMGAIPIGRTHWFRGQRAWNRRLNGE